VPTDDELKKVIILFDEQGTPTFGYQPNSPNFLGVSITYDLSDEDMVFKKCDELFGLSKSRPLKNDKISPSKAIEISELISGLPLQVIVVSVDLSNVELQSVVRLYKEFGDIVRQKKRHVRERRIPQILHSQVLESTLFHSVTRYIKRFGVEVHFMPFMDQWSIPLPDRTIITHKQMEWLAKHVHTAFWGIVGLAASPLQLLTSDCKRERFVDVVASVVSRSFLRGTHERYSPEVLGNVLRNNANEHRDETQRIVSSLRKFMDRVARGDIP
jgi:hypothetical protein